MNRNKLNNPLVSFKTQDNININKIKEIWI